MINRKGTRSKQWSTKH